MYGLLLLPSHPLVVAAPTAKPVAWKVSIIHFCTKLYVFICVIYEARFEGNTSFLTQRLVNCPCCHLVVTSKSEYYCVSWFCHRVSFKS